MTTVHDRLLAGLRALGLDLPEGTRLERTYAGRLQRSAGAMSWFAVGPRGEDLRIGSHWPMRELAGRKLTASWEPWGDRDDGGGDTKIDLAAEQED